jgi:hypothetical protein
VGVPLSLSHAASPPQPCVAALTTTPALHDIATALHAVPPLSREFLTHETTCASEMLERPPANFFFKKDPLRVAAPLARRHVARAAWASAGRPLPPLPLAAPWHAIDAGDVAHHAAVAIGGTLACDIHFTHLHLLYDVTLPATRMAAGPTRPTGDYVPATVTAAGACRRWPRLHVPRVAWPGGAATRRGSFLTKNFAGGLF